MGVGWEWRSCLSAVALRPSPPDVYTLRRSAGGVGRARERACGRLAIAGPYTSFTKGAVRHGHREARRRGRPEPDMAKLDGEIVEGRLEIVGRGRPGV